MSNHDSLLNLCDDVFTAMRQAVCATDRPCTLAILGLTCRRLAAVIIGAQTPWRHPTRTDWVHWLLTHARDNNDIPAGWERPTPVLCGYACDTPRETYRPRFEQLVAFFEPPALPPKLRQLKEYEQFYLRGRHADHLATLLLMALACDNHAFLLFVARRQWLHSLESAYYRYSDATHALFQRLQAAALTKGYRFIVNILRDKLPSICPACLDPKHSARRETRSKKKLIRRNAKARHLAGEMKTKGHEATIKVVVVVYRGSERRPASLIVDDEEEEEEEEFLCDYIT